MQLTLFWRTCKRIWNVYQLSSASAATLYPVLTSETSGSATYFGVSTCFSEDLIILADHPFWGKQMVTKVLNIRHPVHAKCPKQWSNHPRKKRLEFASGNSKIFLFETASIPPLSPPSFRPNVSQGICPAAQESGRKLDKTTLCRTKV
jgi:hypothetical protein